METRRVVRNGCLAERLASTHSGFEHLHHASYPLQIALDRTDLNRMERQSPECIVSDLVNLSLDLKDPALCMLSSIREANARVRFVHFRATALLLSNRAEHRAR